MGYKGSLHISGGYLTYGRAQNLLGKRSSRVLGNNTTLEKRYGGDIAVQHWSTDIITYRPDGSIIVDTSGWWTATTKARLNLYVNGVSFFSDRGHLVHGFEDDTTYIYEDGMEIAPDGRIKGLQPRYAAKLADYLKVEIPDNEALFKVLRGLTLEQCEKVWKRHRRYRSIIAQFCVPEFLPLTMTTPASNRSDEAWKNVVATRLRTMEAA